jgi:formate dehydrogenase major subunit
LRGIKDGDSVSMSSRKGETTLRAVLTERMQAGVVYTTFHHPQSGANVVTTENSDWATNCPEYKVTAVQVAKVVADKSEWQRDFDTFADAQQGLRPRVFHKDGGK